MLLRLPFPGCDDSGQLDLHVPLTISKRFNSLVARGGWSTRRLALAIGMLHTEVVVS